MFTYPPTYLLLPTYLPIYPPTHIIIAYYNLPNHPPINYLLQPTYPPTYVPYNFVVMCEIKNLTKVDHILMVWFIDQRVDLSLGRSRVQFLIVVTYVHA
jgi:hypothetical protein